MLPAVAALMPYIQAGSAIYGLGQALGLWGRPKMPEPPPTLSYEEAARRAQDVLNPLYSQQIERSLENVDRSSLARGFYGQLPAAALRRSTAAQLEADRASQVAALANQMVGQSEQTALQQQQLAAQYALGKFDRINQAAQSAGNMGRNLWMDFVTQTGTLPQFPWQKGPAQVTFPVQTALANQTMTADRLGDTTGRYRLRADLPDLTSAWTRGY